MTVRDMLDADVETTHHINELSAPEVDSLDRPAFDELFGRCALGLVALDPTDAVVGFCLIAAAGVPGFPERTAVALQRADAMLHLDRVAFAPGGGGRGLGPKLYDEIDARIDAGLLGPVDGPAVLTSWLGLEPLNQHALDFYRSRDFAEVERHTFDGVTLALMQKHYPR